MQTDLTRITNIRLKLDVKNIRDSGNGTITVAEDGAYIAFNKSFRSVRSITVSPARNDVDKPIEAYDFVSIPNPSGFTVYLYATDGVNVGEKITGDFSWSAEGI